MPRPRIDFGDKIEQGGTPLRIGTPKRSTSSARCSLAVLGQIDALRRTDDTVEPQGVFAPYFVEHAANRMGDEGSTIRLPLLT